MDLNEESYFSVSPNNRTKMKGLFYMFNKRILQRRSGGADFGGLTPRRMSRLLMNSLLASTADGLGDIVFGV